MFLVIFFTISPLLHSCSFCFSTSNSCRNLLFRYYHPCIHVVDVNCGISKLFMFLLVHEREDGGNLIIYYEFYVYLVLELINKIKIK